MGKNNAGYAFAAGCSHLSLQKLVKIGLHETLNDVDIFHLIHTFSSQNVPDVDHILMIESGQDFDLPQRSLAVRLVLKGRNLLDGHFGVGVLLVFGRHHHAVCTLADVVQIVVAGTHTEDLTANGLPGWLRQQRARFHAH